MSVSYELNKNDEGKFSYICLTHGVGVHAAPGFEKGEVFDSPEEAFNCFRQAIFNKDFEVATVTVNTDRECRAKSCNHKATHIVKLGEGLPRFTVCEKHTTKEAVNTLWPKQQVKSIK